MPPEGTAVPSAASDPALIPISDSGQNLEAAVPPTAPMQPQDTVRRPQPVQVADELSELSGTFAPLSTDASYLPDGSGDHALSVDQRFEHLLDTLHRNRPADDLSIVRDAWQFCKEQHEGQKRASGEPYIVHPLAVAQVLAEMKMDSTAIAAGLLHDAVEDTPVTSPEIGRRFGEQVAHIVEGVTKLDKIKFANKEDHQAENIRKMLLAMVTDIRVVLIKMADRLHNMRTLGALRPDKQARIARETLDIYAPLAHRLGMGKLRGEFEDLAFRYVDPEAYDHLSAAVETLKEQGGEAFLDTVVRTLESELHRHGLPGRVEHRTKRLYSIQQKLPAIAAGADIDIAQVHDLYAVRIITTTPQDCYAVFGLVQSLWHPVPGRYKDFIATARPNGYKSIHNTLMAQGGHQFEIQIRTEDMHRIAEDGIAAHWKYKANETVSAKDDQRLAWVRQLMEWQREMSDPNEFMSTLKIDLYPEEVYTFTPKGKVVVLPKDSSPVDFAYTVHTEVGHTTVAAKVNGRIVPLRHRLRNGDIVEITTQAGHTPSRDWLTFAKSSRARNKIKHWLNEHQRERAIEIGTKLLEREARKFDVSLKKLTDSDYTRVANEYGLGSQPDLVAGIGFGKYSARQTLNRLVPGSTAPGNDSAAADAAAGTNNGAGNNTAGGNTPGTARGDAGSSGAPGNPSTLRMGATFGTVPARMSDDARRVYFGKGAESLQVEGQNDLLIYRARCCNPIRGEGIVGYVTRGKGVAVHARTCSNVQNLLYESDRRIAVEWSPTPEDQAEQLRRSQTASKAARFATPEASSGVTSGAQAAGTPASRTSPSPQSTGPASPLEQAVSQRAALPHPIGAEATTKAPAPSPLRSSGAPSLPTRIDDLAQAATPPRASRPSEFGADRISFAEEPPAAAAASDAAAKSIAHQGLASTGAKAAADASGQIAGQVGSADVEPDAVQVRSGYLPGAEGKPDQLTVRNPTTSAAEPEGRTDKDSHSNRRPGYTRGDLRQLSTNLPKPTRFPVRLVITCDDRSGMLKQLTATIADDDTNIRSVDSKSNPDGITANVEFVIETLDLSHLTKLTANLRRLPGIREVHRASKL